MFWLLLCCFALFVELSIFVILSMVGCLYLVVLLCFPVNCSVCRLCLGLREFGLGADLCLLRSCWFVWFYVLCCYLMIFAEVLLVDAGVVR